jgi:8-oxoguanine deaminase
MRLWIKDPLAILAAGAERGIVVEGTRIVELVGRGQMPRGPFDAAYDASRHVVLPGLVNAHHHFYQTLVRAHPAGLKEDLVPWLVALYPIWGRITPAQLRLSVRMALVELLLSGCTTAADHHNLFPVGMENAIDLEVEEARSLRLRLMATRGAMSFSVKDGGLPPDNVVQSDDAVYADCERVLKLFHDPNPGSMTQIAFAPCSPFAVNKPLFVALGKLAKTCDCRLHTHLCQIPDEERFCVEAHGMRPVDFLEDNGWLNSRLWMAHAVHFNDEDIRRLGAAGVGVCHCAASDMALSAGICPTKDFEAAGAPVGLGVDGSSSNDSSNMMEALRHSLMIGRLRYGASKVTHLDVLRWGTEGSARCLGRDDIGKIEVGKEADLALFTLDEPRFSGAHDPIAALVLCGAHRADRVMVAGDWRVVDGAPVGIDLEQLMAHHREAARAFA